MPFRSHTNPTFTPSASKSHPEKIRKHISLNNNSGKSSSISLKHLSNGIKYTPLKKSSPSCPKMSSSITKVPQFIIQATSGSSLNTASPKTHTSININPCISPQKTKPAPSFITQINPIDTRFFPLICMPLE